MQRNSEHMKAKQGFHHLSINISLFQEQFYVPISIHSPYSYETSCNSNVPYVEFQIIGVGSFSPLQYEDKYFLKWQD